MLLSIMNAALERYPESSMSESTKNRRNMLGRNMSTLPTPAMLLDIKEDSQGFDMLEAA